MPTTVEGVVTEATESGYVIANGVKYEYSKTAGDNGSATETLGYTQMNDAKYALGSNYKLFMDPNGYVLGVDGVKAKVDLSKYLFLNDETTDGFDRIAQVIFTDGTKKSVVVSKYTVNGDTVDVTKNTSLAPLKGKFYT